jgi:hypothetical protein
MTSPSSGEFSLVAPLPARGLARVQGSGADGMRGVALEERDDSPWSELRTRSD